MASNSVPGLRGPADDPNIVRQKSEDDEETRIWEKEKAEAEGD